MQKIIILILKLAIIIIIGSNAILKLVGSSESLILFTELGFEPWGRYFVGIIELTSVVLLISRSKMMWGISLISIIMIGAIISHVLILGFSGENFILFITAFGVLIMARVIYFLEKNL